MNIDSKSNGGGFKAKGIINAYGIDAGKKGILSTVSIDEAIKDADGKYLETLKKISILVDE